MYIKYIVLANNILEAVYGVEVVSEAAAVTRSTSLSLLHDLVPGTSHHGYQSIPGSSHPELEVPMQTLSLSPMLVRTQVPDFQTYQINSPHMNTNSDRSTLARGSAIPSPGSAMGSPFQMLTEHIQLGIKLYIVLLFRICINLLPILFAAWIPDFYYVINYVGGISVLICLVFPAILSIYTSKQDYSKYPSNQRRIPSIYYMPPSQDWKEYPWLQSLMLGIGLLLSLLIIISSMMIVTTNS